MEVHKFGGGILNSAPAIKHLSEVLKKIECEKPAVIVVSALGKTTNMLEKLADAYFSGNTDKSSAFEEIKDYHWQIVDGLFADKSDGIFEAVNDLFVALERETNNKSAYPYNQTYDQIVCYGELLSARIVSAYLKHMKIDNKLWDARDFIKTNDTYREALVDWTATKQLLNKKFENESEPVFLVTQGFIGKNNENFSTTLGREGSDYTAGLIGNIMNVSKVVLWKDVPGVMDKNPHIAGGENAKLISEIFYEQFEKLLQKNAKGLVHPKTLNEVKHKKISLQIRPFWDLQSHGTMVV
ncbi:MAG: Aspartokinase [Parcubacteria group bacterium GW2011_GWF2_38_8]|nr:MAG: Aspartokinase [Parcubacteria group bacterium GW2011_GWF2_38_8]